MERIRIKAPRGINKDISPFELPLDKWSDGNNVNFRRIRTNSYAGYSNPFTLANTVVKPTFVQYFSNNINIFWIYCGDDVDGSHVYKTDGVITSPLNGEDAAFPLVDRDNNWSGCDFNSVVVLNSKAAHPQSLQYPYDELAPLPNWEVVVAIDDPVPGRTTIWGTGSRCEVIRPYKNYLIAMDCYDQNEVRYANMLRWSAPAQLGEVPATWDPELIGSQSGVYNLADTPGRVVDGLTLGDYFIVYKTDAVWMMQFIGGAFVMKFRKLFGDDTGILSKNCVVEYAGKHFVLATNGCYIHNGSSKEEVMDNWVKDEFFDNVAQEYISNTRVIADHNNSEIWIYYISKEAAAASNNPYADKALIWHWLEGEWTKKDLQDIAWIAEGYIEPATTGVYSWNSAMSNQWDATTSPWSGDKSFNKVLEGLLMAGYEGKKFFANDYIEGTDVYLPNSYAKRIGISFDDDRTFKQVTRIVPHFSSTTPVDITIYVSDTQTTTPTEIQTTSYNPLTDVDVDCHAVGRYIGIKFESSLPWKMEGYTIEYENVGSF